MEYQQTPPTPPQVTIPARPKTWLVESILVTILCCLPFGIVGIIFAAKVNSLYDQTKYEEAKRTSANAKRWTIIGFTIGLVFGLFYFGYVIYMVTSGNLSEMGLPGLEGLTF